MDVCARDVRSLMLHPLYYDVQLSIARVKPPYAACTDAHLEHAESRKVADCAISVLFHFSYEAGSA